MHKCLNTQTLHVNRGGALYIHRQTPPFKTNHDTPTRADEKKHEGEQYAYVQP